MARQFRRRLSPGDAPPEPAGKSGSPLHRPLSGWISGVTLGLILLLVAWLWLHARIGEIISDSMSPTLVRGDYYLIRLDAYHNSEPRRGDVIVIRDPARDEELVKRVIGVGGDEVGVWFGRAYVNGAMLDEPYIAQRPGVHESPVGEVVAPGELYLLGDNRNFSEDSRDIGTLPAANVVGRVTGVILPWAHRRHFQDTPVKAPPPQTASATAP